MKYLNKTHSVKGRTYIIPRAGLQPRAYNKLPEGENILGPLAVYLLLAECSTGNNTTKITEKAIATHLQISERSVIRHLKKLYSWKMIRKHTARPHMGKDGTLVTETNTYEIYEGKNKSSCLYWVLKQKFDLLGNDKSTAMALYALMRSKLQDMPMVHISVEDLIKMTGASRNVILRVIQKMVDVRLIVRIKGKGKSKSQFFFTNEFLYDIETQALIRTSPGSSVYLNTTVESYINERKEIEQQKWIELENQLKILRN